MGATKAWRAATILFAGAFAVSLAMQLRASRRAGEVAYGAAPDGRGQLQAGEGDGVASRCSVELELCRTQSAQLTVRALSTNLAVGDVVPAATGAPDAARDDSATDLDAQKRVFCGIAEEHVRAHWASQRDKIVATLDGLGTDAFARKWTNEAVAKLGRTMGLRDDEKRRVARSYDALWAAHGARMQARLAAQPQDYAGLLEDVRAFWRDEDAMIARELGDAARDDFRATELRSRTAIAAILATFANRKTYDDATAW